MDIKTLASILITLHLISGVFIVLVLKTQWGLFKTQIAKPLRTYRKVLFALSLVIFIGNLNPILIDAQTLLSNTTQRPTHLKPISISYATSNALTALISSVLIYILYRMAGDATKKAKAGKQFS